MKSLYERALDHLEAREYDEAETTLKEYLSKNPTDAQNNSPFFSSYKWMYASNKWRHNGLSSQMPIVSKASPSKV